MAGEITATGGFAASGRLFATGQYVNIHRNGNNLERDGSMGHQLRNAKTRATLHLALDRKQNEKGRAKRPPLPLLEEVLLTCNPIALVAGACNHPNCLVLPFRLERIRRAA